MSQNQQKFEPPEGPPPSYPQPVHQDAGPYNSPGSPFQGDPRGNNGKLWLAGAPERGLRLPRPARLLRPASTIQRRWARRLWVRRAAAARADAVSAAGLRRRVWGSGLRAAGVLRESTWGAGRCGRGHLCGAIGRDGVLLLSGYLDLKTERKCGARYGLSEEVTTSGVKMDWDEMASDA